MKVDIDYKFSLNFDSDILDHRFTLRVTPRETDFYKIIEFETNDLMHHTLDGFGNTISFGTVKASHKEFKIYSYAKVKFISDYKQSADSYHHSIFLYDTKLTKINATLKQWIGEFNISDLSFQNKILYINEYVYQNIKYQKNVTTVSTTIDEITQNKKGVCQDFAHLMITILRHLDIPARYVSGFIQGEGETHAWLEYFDGEFWYGADPTNNRLIKHEPYIKIAHGRDASDVYVNQGVFVGKATQKLDIHASMNIQ
jgi:transglutaminase-like putative cysteine protease